ncbi:Gfo/Idh/MocA family oxidoreductase [Paenibacillus sp. HB172176]|uniref:Gfo/Idh/MocA family protein n=1 Tax=Paenibacillus sp. HB172176 TaxID=2493690 RepID=UPI001438ECA4|nr:Gfo/Idh/MocA family oxidoreductase [Paenibacillus sp. HB172176]
MTESLKFGIVGAGNIFKSAHLPHIMAAEDMSIVAICDINEERAKTLAEEHGIPHVFTDYNEMLEKCPEINALDICTPNLYHSKVAVAGLKAGKHVFCEKPDAVNPEEAQKMADAAIESGKMLMVMRNNRFTPASQYLKRYIEEGHMGDIYTGRCGWVRRRGIPGKGGWFTNKELSGGGPLIDLGVHFIDLAIWLMGNPKPIAVSGATYSKFADNELSDSIHSKFGEKQADGVYDVEDLATGFIRFDNGATLQIEFSWASNVETGMNFVELRGTKAGSSIRNSELEIYSETAGQLVDIKPVLRKDSVGGHGRNILHFADCVLRGESPIFEPEQGVNMVKILTAIYESAETGREVRL